MVKAFPRVIFIKFNITLRQITYYYDGDYMSVTGGVSHKKNEIKKATDYRKHLYHLCHFIRLVRLIVSLGQTAKK